MGCKHVQLALFAQVGDKAADAALVAHGLGAVIRLGLLAILQHGGIQLPLIPQGDAQARIQEALFPQALFQGVKVEMGGLLEHLRVRLEGDPGAGIAFRHIPDDLQRAVRLAAAEGLLVLVAVPAHLDGEPLRAGVHHRSAHAVQAAGHLVAGVLAAKLAACVQDGVHHRHCRQAGVGLDIHRDATAVVGHLDQIAFQDLDLNMVTVTGQRLVDGVVHDLVHQMVQAPLAGGADIHTRPLAHRLQAFQHLDLAGVVLVVGSGIGIGRSNDLFCHIHSPFCLFGFRL